MTFLRDHYMDRPRSERERLSEEVRRLRALQWGDPGDRELKQAMEEAERALRSYDTGARP